MFEAEVAKTVKAHDVRILKQVPKHEIQKIEYAMFPAWFLTLRYKGLPYTMLVNGQTGKLVAGLPYDEKKVCAYMVISGTLLSVGAFVICHILMRLDDGWMAEMAAYLFVIFGFALCFVGYSAMKGVEESTKLTSLAETNSYVNDKQGRD